MSRSLTRQKWFGPKAIRSPIVQRVVSLLDKKFRSGYTKFSVVWASTSATVGAALTLCFERLLPHLAPASPLPPTKVNNNFKLSPIKNATG